MIRILEKLFNWKESELNKYIKDMASELVKNDEITNKMKNLYLRKALYIF